MTLRRMFDAAWPPASPPDADVAAGYIGGNTPHVWTDAEWAASGKRWRLPIFTRSHDGDPKADAAASIAWLRAHNVPKGMTLALDFETRVDATYLNTFDAAVVGAGWKVMVYGSHSYVYKNPKPSGGYWDAEWNNIPHLSPGSAATQYGGLPTYDLSLVADSTPLWDTQGEDMPLTDADADLVVERWQAKYGMRLAQWIAGKTNTVYNTTSVGVTAPKPPTADEIATTVNAQILDPVAVADALAGMLGPELAGAVCEEMSARLAT